MRTFSRTDSARNRLFFWNVRPMPSWQRTSGRSFVMSRSRSSTRPDDG
jgi:hypothetical protein